MYLSRQESRKHKYQHFSKEKKERIMKKQLQSLMAIVAVLGMVFAAGPVMAGTAGDTGGSIPAIRTIDSVVVDTAEMTGTFFSGLVTGDYDTGYKISDSDATVTTVTANTSWEVTVAAGRTGNFFTTSPLGLGDSARTVNEKPIADLLLKISAIDEGIDANSSTPTIDGAWADFTALTFASQDFMTSASGNDSAHWDIQYKMLLESPKDRDGAFSADIVYTIQAISD
jgi:hypothetical protein